MRGLDDQSGLGDVDILGGMHCVMGPEILTGTGTKVGTRNMTGPGPGPRLGPKI